MISLVIVTKGDVDLSPIFDSAPFGSAPFYDIVVWDNSAGEELSVYGRYAAIGERAQGEFIAVQDDDCIVPWDALLDAYKPGERLCNMDAAKQAEYDKSSLLGWGAIFPREDPVKAFERYAARYDTDTERFRRTCDVVFSALSPFRRVDLGRIDLPYWNDTTRMHLQDEHYAERGAVTLECQMLPRLSVVIPTTGRKTLAAAVESARDADEIIVVQDGCRATIPTYQQVRVASVQGKGRDAADVGYTARTHGMDLATGTHIAFMDDDDIYTDGAIDLMREAASDRPVMFKMDHPEHGILWRAPVVAFGNVSTQMVVVPNAPEKFGVWEAHAPHLPEPGGDYTFIQGCVQKMGEPVWRDEVICTIKPHERRTVAVVTPWLEHHELAANYRHAIHLGPAPQEVIVVDNGDAPDDFPLIPAGENLGFAAASNLGLRAATADIVVFLNNDITATREGWLRDLVAAVEPGVLVGHEIRYDDHGDVDGEQYPYIDGWCLAGMREDFLELGGFDETYDEPAYFSDNELCFRARVAGMTLREVPVGLVHIGGATSNANGHFLPSTLANRDRFQALVRETLTPA